eukprot:scaffold158148_cov30-Tisochrysis_lutea.AAC.4
MLGLLDRANERISATRTLHASARKAEGNLRVRHLGLSRRYEVGGRQIHARVAQRLEQGKGCRCRRWHCRRSLERSQQARYKFGWIEGQQCCPASWMCANGRKEQVYAGESGCCVAALIPRPRVRFELLAELLLNFNERANHRILDCLWGH